MYGSFSVLIKKYVCVYVCVCVCVWVTFLKSFTALSASGLRTSLECTGEYSATAMRAAVTRVRRGRNLNCTFQILAIFSHPCTAYRQLQFCVQSLLDGLCKRAKFQVRFRPFRPDHSLVRNKVFSCWFVCQSVRKKAVGQALAFTLTIYRSLLYDSALTLNSVTVLTQLKLSQALGGMLPSRRTLLVVHSTNSRCQVGQRLSLQYENSLTSNMRYCYSKDCRYIS
jgi:hypothetical protein